jgi:membrane protein
VGSSSAASQPGPTSGTRPRASSRARPLLSGEHHPLARSHALLRSIVRGFEENDLLTYASAISFQILTAVVPFLLFVLALAQLLHANDIWRLHLEPQVKANVSPAIFSAIQSSVNKVFAGRAVIWVTLGGLLAVWQVSGAVRAVMGALARVYDAPRERPFLKRYSISFILSLEVIGCFILVAMCVLFAPFFHVAHPGLAYEALSLVVRWGLVILILLVVVALLVRHGPSRSQPAPWVTLGAAIVIVSWVVVSLIFDFYLSDVASYQSAFGGLAAAIAAMAYLYISTTVFLFGAQLDAIIRHQATGCPAGTGEPLAEPESDLECEPGSPAEARELAGSSVSS